MNKKRIIVLFILIAIISITYFVKITGKTGNKIEQVSYNQENNTFTCNYRGLSRSFILCLPEDYNNQTSILIMLHGLGGSAFNFKNDTFMEKTANPRNYAVIYMEGTVDPENKSHGKGWQFHQNKISKNDVAFIIDLAKYCQNTYKLGNRVFAVGFSNGGFMVNKLASTRPDFFTGVASVAGMMPKDVWEVRKNKGSIAYLQINGTKDDVVPMDLNGSSKLSPNPAMEKVIDYYIDLNKISHECKTYSISNVATMQNYDSKVAWVIIEDGRHNWPSMSFSKFEPNDLILDFFDKQ